MAAERRGGGRAETVREPAERAADHAAIERLADDLVPALIAKLSASGLGEIEIGEDAWTIRVRRPAEGAGGQNRRASDRASRSQPGHAGHGHAPGGFEGHRIARDPKAAGAVPLGTSSNGASAAASVDGAAMTAPARPS